MLSIATAFLHLRYHGLNQHFASSFTYHIRSHQLRKEHYISSSTYNQKQNADSKHITNSLHPTLKSQNKYTPPHPRSFIRQNIPSLHIHLPIRLILALKPQSHKVPIRLIILLFNLPITHSPRRHDFGFVKRRGSRIQCEYILAFVQIGQGGVGTRWRNRHEVVYARAVRDRWCWRIRVRVDDFIAALFAFSDDGCDAAEYAFAFCVCALFGVAVEDFGGRKEAGFEDV
jgi:hypothetical protein